MVAMLPTESRSSPSASWPPFCPSLAAASRTDCSVSVTSMNGIRSSSWFVESSRRCASAVKSVLSTQLPMLVTIWLICRKARNATPVNGRATVAIAASSVTVADRPTFILARSRS